MVNHDLEKAINVFATFLNYAEENNLAKLLLEAKNDLCDLEAHNETVLVLKKLSEMEAGDLLHLKDQPTFRGFLIDHCNNLILSLQDKNDGSLSVLCMALSGALDNMVGKMVELSKHQLIILKQSIKKIADIILKNKTDLPVVVLEFPVGNSIPCRLLQRMLEEKGIDYSIINIALLRNESKRIGLTRKDIIINKLNGLRPSFIVYMDEWESGNNFNKINQILFQLKEHTIMPVGFLADFSAADPSYSKYKGEHERFAGKCGIPADNLRFSFPLLDEPYLGKTFVWGENDKLAGYTKTEFAGDAYFSIAEKIKELKAQPSIIGDFLFSDQGLRGSDYQGVYEVFITQCDYFLDNFSEKWKASIEEIKELNEYTDPQLIVNNALKAAENIGDYDHCKMAIALAINLLRKSQISPLKQYYFKGLVPVCLRLEGQELRLNELFIQHCVALDDFWMPKP